MYLFQTLSALNHHTWNAAFKKRLLPRIRLFSIKLLPTKWSRHVCMRMELYGLGKLYETRNRLQLDKFLVQPFVRFVRKSRLNPWGKKAENPAPDQARLPPVKNNSPRQKSRHKKFLGHKFCERRCAKSWEYSRQSSLR